MSRQYLFVSSISVYPNFSEPRTEDSAVGTLKDETVEKVDNETYGPLKALWRKRPKRRCPGASRCCGPGLIVGPHDSTDRFTYWPARAARGGDMLAPGTPRDRIQIIDARDLAAFALDALERRRLRHVQSRVAARHVHDGRRGERKHSCRATLAKPSPPPRAVWANAAFLDAQKVEGWSDMPVWIRRKVTKPRSRLPAAARAMKEGLKITPMRKTVTDTLAWHLQRPEAERTKLKAGIDAAREQEVLGALAASSAKPAMHRRAAARASPSRDARWCSPPAHTSRDPCRSPSASGLREASRSRA